MVRKKKSLLLSEGELSPKERKEVLSLIMSNWDLEKPVDIMLANRMVATWSMIRRVEVEVEKRGLFFEQTSKVNPLCYYLQTLQSDLLRFYRVFQQRVPAGASTGQNFSEWIGELESNKS